MGMDLFEICRGVPSCILFVIMNDFYDLRDMGFSVHFVQSVIIQLHIFMLIVVLALLAVDTDLLPSVSQLPKAFKENKSLLRI